MNEKFIWEDTWNEHLSKIAYNQFQSATPVYRFLRQWMLLSPITIHSFFTAINEKDWLTDSEKRKLHKSLKRYSKKELQNFLSLYFLDYLNDFSENSKLHTSLATIDLTPEQFITSCLNILDISSNKRLQTIWDSSKTEQETFYHTIQCIQWLGIHNNSEPICFLFEDLKQQLYSHFDNYLLKIVYSFRKTN